MAGSPVYFIEHPGCMSHVAAQRMHEQWTNALAGTELEGAKFLILEEGMRLRSHRLAENVEAKDLQDAIKFLRENDRRGAADALAAFVEHFDLKG